MHVCRSFHGMTTVKLLIIALLLLLVFFKDSKNFRRTEFPHAAFETRVAPVALCVLALDAEAYIEEWMHFHEALGIEHFFVFDLDDQLELDNWAFGRQNVNVTHFPAVNVTDVRRFRAKLEKTCFEMARTVGYGWAGLLDVDEFILFPQELDTHIVDILAKLGEDYLPLHGRLFASENRTYQPLPVTKRVREFIDMNWTKYLVRLENWTEGQRSKQLENSDKPGVLATLNCYWKKSIKELHEKCSESPSRQVFALQCTANELLKNSSSQLNIDEMAWVFLKKKVPYYSGFDLMLPTSEPRYQPSHADTVALCAIMINEEAYIDEWADYHLALGVSHIFVYDNSQAWELRTWAESRLKVSSFHYTHDQTGAYADCLVNRVRPGNYKWAAFWDVDEFLILRDHRNLIDYLAEYLHNGSLSSNWLIFGPAGHKVYEPKPVTKRFQMSESKVNQHVKTISRTKDIRFQQVHHADLLKGVVQKDAAGLKMKQGQAEWREGPFNLFNEEGLQSKALIFHYEYKSYKELVKKRLRGRADIRMSMEERKARMRQDMTLHIDTCCPHPEHRAWEKLKEYLPHYQMYDRPVQVQVNLRAV